MAISSTPWVSVAWAGCVTNPANLHDWRAIVAGLRWDERPTAAGAIG